MADPFLTLGRRFRLKRADVVPWCPKENRRSLGFAPNDKEQGGCFQEESA